MRLSDRLGRAAAPSQQPLGPAPKPLAGDDLAGVAARIHPKIIERLDLAAVQQLSHDELKLRLRVIVEQVVAAERLAINEAERESMLKDPSISDVLVNGHDKVYVERAGKLVPVEIRFRDDRHLIHTIQRMVAR